MRGVKNFDFFQKISLDDVRQSTLYGALLSISAITLMTYLLFMELFSFMTPSIKRDTIVYHHPEQYSLMNINFGIQLSKMPCHIISVDQADQLGNHRMDIDETLKKISINSNVGKEIITKFVEVQKVVEAINNGEGCYISGYIPVSKVDGNFHLSHHNYVNVYNFLKSERNDLLKKISFSHQFKHIYFGENEVDKTVLKKFGMSDFNSFTGAGKLPNYENEKAILFSDYFIKLIPHLLIDEISGEQYMTYQYSLTHKIEELDDDDEDSEDMPIIQVNYELSPITIKISLVRKSFMHSLTHICAIVGGVYVLFSLLNKFLIFLSDSFESEKK